MPSSVGGVAGAILPPRPDSAASEASTFVYVPFGFLLRDRHSSWERFAFVNDGHSAFFLVIKGKVFEFVIAKLQWLISWFGRALNRTPQIVV